MWDNTAQHLTSLHGVVDAEDNVFSSIGRWARAQNRRLYVTYFECGSFYRHVMMSALLLQISTPFLRPRYKSFYKMTSRSVPHELSFRNRHKSHGHQQNIYRWFGKICLFLAGFIR